jgi:hypothetical protein
MTCVKVSHDPADRICKINGNLIGGVWLFRCLLLSSQLLFIHSDLFTIVNKLVEHLVGSLALRGTPLQVEVHVKFVHACDYARLLKQLMVKLKVILLFALHLLALVLVANLTHKLPDPILAHIQTQIVNRPFIV